MTQANVDDTILSAQSGIGQFLQLTDQINWNKTTQKIVSALPSLSSLSLSFLYFPAPPFSSTVMQSHLHSVSFALDVEKVVFEAQQEAGMDVRAFARRVEEYRSPTHGEECSKTRRLPNANLDNKTGDSNKKALNLVMFSSSLMSCLGLENIKWKKWRIHVLS